MPLATKLTVVLRDDLDPNLAANAAAVLGLSLGGRLADLLGQDGKDASGVAHAGLNTHPVPVLTASSGRLRELGARAGAVEEVLMVGFTEVARRAREYEEYLRDLAVTPTEDVDYVGLALFGPRNAITKLTRALPLMDRHLTQSVAPHADALGQ